MSREQEQFKQSIITRAEEFSTHKVPGTYYICISILHISGRQTQNQVYRTKLRRSGINLCLDLYIT